MTDDRPPRKLPPPGEDERTIVGLALEFKKVRRAAEAVDVRVRQAGITGELNVANELERLGEAIDALTERGQRVEAPNWYGIDDDTRDEQMAELAGWVDEVLIPFFPDSAPKRCWRDHPGVVWELSVVAALWRRAYEQEHPDLDRAAEWLDRWLPNAAGRVSDAQADCQPGRQDGQLWVCAVTRRRRDIAS